MKAAIFDLDGTLIDSMPDCMLMGKEILDKFNIKYPDNITEILTPLGYVKGAEYMIKLGIDLTPQELMDLEFSYLKGKYENSIPLKPYAMEYLLYLKARGVKLCGLTASPTVLINSCVKRLKLNQILEFIITCDEVGLSKSDTKIYSLVSAKLNETPHDITMFDDNLINLKTAKKAGLKTVGVYDISSENSKDEIIATADKYIYSFKELL